MAKSESDGRKARTSACSEFSWIDEGLTLKELLEFARHMLQTRLVPYQADWDVTDDLIDDMAIPMVRIPR